MLAAVIMACPNESSASHEDRGFGHLLPQF